MITNFNDMFGKATVYIVGENGMILKIPASLVSVEYKVFDSYLLVDPLEQRPALQSLINWTIEAKGIDQPATLTQREDVTNDIDFYNILEE